MKKRRLAKKILLPLVAVLFLMLSACQSVGGVDLTKALINNAMVNSLMGNLVVAWDMELDKENEQQFFPYDEESMRYLEMFRKGSVEIKNMKLQSKDHLSADIIFHVAQRNIPVKVYVEGETYTFALDGYGKLIKADDNKRSLYGFDRFSRYAFGELNEVAKKDDIREQIAKVLFHNFPNPSNISSDTSVETINGENVSLTKVKAEFSGSELPDLIYRFIDNLLKDENNVKRLITLLTEEEQNEASSITKEEADEQYQKFKEFAGLIKKNIEDENYWMLGFLFKKSNYVKAELGIDSNSNIRKTSHEVFIKLGGIIPIRSLKITFDAETWNINQPVAADKPADSAQYAQPDEYADPIKFLSGINKESDLYKLLKDDLKINQIRKQFRIFPIPPKYYYGDVIMVDDIGMIGARTLASQMRYNLTWDQDDQKIKLTSGEKYIIFKIDSKSAIANGQEVELSSVPRIMNNIGIVPIRAAAEALDTKIEYNQDANSLILSRE